MPFAQARQNLQVKLENEKDIYCPDYKLPGSPDSMPYRKIWDVSFYNNKAELISLHEIAKSGPFVGVASAEKSEGVKEEFKNQNYKISLHPVIEYSLELPYGRQARIWVTTETACYRIMSVSANYVSFWQPFYEMVCFAGHTINILLNYKGTVILMKLVNKISKLSGKDSNETHSLLREHRKFIQDLLKDQNLSPRTRKEFTALQSNQTIWEMEWEELSKTTVKKLGKKSSLNISTFFNSRSVIDNNINVLDSSNNLDSTIKKGNNFDETSSLLSISDDESATYIEYPSEPTKEIDKSNIFDCLEHSFTSVRFIEWKLSEGYSFQESFYRCPVCRLTFKTNRNDCISSFSVHLRAHLADINTKPNNWDDDMVPSNFEIRHSNFRNDLQRIITGKNNYNPILMKFDKNLDNSISIVVDQPFKKYTGLYSVETDSVYHVINPVKALKFKSSAAISTIQAPKTQSAQLSKESSVSDISAVATTPPVKKPRTRKVSVVLPSNVAPSIESNPTIVKLPVNNKLSKSQIAATNTNPDQEKFTASLPSVSSISDNSQSKHSSIISSTLAVSSQSLNAPSSNISPSKCTETSVSGQANINSLPLSDRSQLSNLTANTLKISNNQKQIEEHSANANPVTIEIVSDDVLIPVPSISDLVISYSVDERQLGCSHYKVNCKYFAECCSKWFTCRFCHDANNDHQVNRRATRFCLCMFCGTSQMASSRCVNLKCKSLLAHYYCNICKFWDNDSNKPIYHCNKCNTCRIGLRTNLEHCEACDKLIKSSTLKTRENIKNVVLQSSNQARKSSLKLKLNFSDSPSPSEKKQKLDNYDKSAPVIGNSRTSPIEISENSSLIDQTNYINSLKNSLDNKYSRSKPTLSAASKPINSCWNCLNSLSIDSTSKYCPNCSAVIE